MYLFKLIDFSFINLLITILIGVCILGFISWAIKEAPIIIALFIGAAIYGVAKACIK